MSAFENVLVSALTSALVLGLAIFIVKVFFKASYEGWLTHQFNRHLEELKSSLRKEEERLKADIASQERRLNSLTSVALSGMATRNEVLDRRRIEALEKLWHGVIELRPLRSAARFTESLKMPAIIARAARGSADASKLQQFAEMIWSSSGLEGYKLPDTPDRERPFISPLVWSLFSAYRQLAAFPMAQLAAAKTGFGEELLEDTAPMLKLAKEVLPNCSTYIDQWGTASIPHLLEPLENMLLTEIVSNLEGRALDQETVAHAYEIQRLAEKARAKPNVEVPEQALVTADVPPP